MTRSLTITFDESDEAYFKATANAVGYYLAMSDITDELRRMGKYEEHTIDESAIIERIRDMVSSIKTAHGIGWEE